MHDNHHTADPHGVNRRFGIGNAIVFLFALIIILIGVGFAFGYFSFDDETEIISVGEEKVFETSETFGLETMNMPNVPEAQEEMVELEPSSGIDYQEPEKELEPIFYSPPIKNTEPANITQ